MSKVTVLGGGSWGTALANVLAENGHEVKIWEFFKEQAEQMQTTRKCPFLPELDLPDSIYITNEMAEALEETEYVTIVVPSKPFPTTLENLKPLLNNHKIVNCTKGFAPNFELLSTKAEEILGSEICFMYGPTLAKEIVAEMPTGMVVAGSGALDGTKNEIKKLFTRPYLKIETSTDPVGIQVAAGLKNIVAIMIGIADGFGFGENTKGYLLTRGLNEIAIVAEKMGASKDTIITTAGVGDLIATSLSPKSRNHTVGEKLAQGKSLETIKSEMEMVTEGVDAATELNHYAQTNNLDLPLLTGIYKVLQKNLSAKELIYSL